MTPGDIARRLAETQRDRVRSRYARIVRRQECCSPEPGARGGCGCGTRASVGTDGSDAGSLGATPVEWAAVPSGADLGLGCGNPTALAELTPRQVVLDLGSGTGVDCFLAATRVGPRGRVIGVDMTPEMVARARALAREGRYRNVDFRLGEIEHLPVADGSVDVVISNCVVNLSPEKGRVYREAFRVLRPGGHLAMSDVVATRRISARDRADPTLWSSCSSGAITADETRRLLRTAGFREIRLDRRFPATAPPSLRGQATLGVVAADLRAVKPRK